VDSFLSEKSNVSALELWDALDPSNSLTDRLILHGVARRLAPGFEPDPAFSDDGEEGGSPEGIEPPYAYSINSGPGDGQDQHPVGG